MRQTFQLTTVVVVGLLLYSCHLTAQTPSIVEAPVATPSTSLPPAPMAEASPPKDEEPKLLPGPNAVPGDTRVVVNIPAFRLDVFEHGAPIKSYRVGIGYPQFPLPTGLRKVQQIIFNPTWTPPHSPWVNSMHVTPGETIGAGSKRNPLGPIKIPIGLPSLIHGGKPLSKIGTFASHGCVGMTNEQVKDFAQVLLKASNTDLSDEMISGYLNTRTRTRVVSLNKLIPVELRYETIVVEDGQLHIYRDVYKQDTNNEESLRAVLKANGVDWSDLTNDERSEAAEGVSAMSRHPQKTTKAKTERAIVVQSPTPSASPDSVAVEARKHTTDRNQNEIVIEIVALRGKGYPVPVTLNTGGVVSGRND